MTTKTKDICVAVSSYKDAQGDQKNRYENVGHVLRMDDGSEMLCLKRTFNPAGCANPGNRDTVVLSLFPVKDAQKPVQQQATQQQMPVDVPDDDVPF